MDYSLLVGIKRRNFEVIDTATKSTTTTTAAAASSAVATSLHTLRNTAAASRSACTNQHTQPQHTLSPGPVHSASDFRDPDGAMHAAVVEGQGTFYIGIIDILQEWNYDKWYERMTKIFLLRKDGKGLSAMDPLNYRKRFFQRAVLDVFDGLGLDDADEADIFERHTVLAGDLGSERDTVDTVLSGLGRGGKDSRGTIGSGSLGLSFSAGGAAGSSPGRLSGGPDGTLRESDSSVSESSSFSHEVQLQALPSSASLRDSSSMRSSSPLGTDRRFQVKPLTK